jgi:hypothetical protein
MPISPLVLMLSTPFMWPFFGDASSETVLRFGRPPLGETPWASRRIVGRFTCPSQAGRFDAL